MPERNTLVSIVLVFFNEERFLEEAIASVYAQAYPHWELLLCDDGSTDESSAIARRHAAACPGRVRYVEHAGHENHGASATRNMGAAAAQGDWIAFLDGDDVWLPERLTRSTAFAAAYPSADMVYGKTEYWHSWRSNGASGCDRVQPHFFKADRLIPPPELLVRHLTLRAALPCMGSLLVRRSAFLQCGGFERSFRGLVDDAVFLGKFCLDHTVYVSEECWDRYRQHAESDTAVAGADGRMRAAQQSYLLWLEAYVQHRRVTNSQVHAAVRRAKRRVARAPGGLRSRFERMARRVVRRLRY